MSDGSRLTSRSRRIALASRLTERGGARRMPSQEAGVLAVVDRVISRPSGARMRPRRSRGISLVS
jgi:hypothetical protein